MEDIIQSLDNQENQMDEIKHEIKTNFVHIWVQQWTTRKSYTIVEDMPEDIDLKKVVRAFKKILKCNGCVKNDKQGKLIILLQGDKRDEVKDFLLSEGIVKEDEIQVHGH